MNSEKKTLLSLGFFLIFLFPLIPSALAAEPIWTYSSPGDEIGDLTITSDGSAIAVAGGKIWLFSKNGVLLAKEPYGDQVIFTPDGSYLISAYSDSLYEFRRGNPKNKSESSLQKMWGASLPGTIRSIDVTDNGKTIVASLNSAGTYIYDSTGKMVTGNKSYNAIMRISSTGTKIVGTHLRVLCLYNRNLLCSASEEGVVGAQPDFLEISNNGNITVFNDGPRVRSVFTDNKTLRWIKNANGDITSLSMTPTGSGILAGTADGNATLFDEFGNISWTYVSNPGNQQNAGITCVAISKEGTVAAAGSQDGKIFALNSTGGIIWSNQTKDRIYHIAMSADGSLVVATGDYTVYAFSTTIQPARAVRTTIKSVTPLRTRTGTPLQGNTSTLTPVTSERTTREITAVPTEYSIIRTTQSPLSGVLSLTGLLITLLLVSLKR
jgi:WD40 repeat protein